MECPSGLWRRERAVSRTVGAVLMVAVAVGIGASVGLFLYDVVATTGEDPPQVSLDARFDGNELVVSHNGGEPLNSDAVTVRMNSEATDVSLDRTASIGDDRFKSGDTWSVSLTANNVTVDIVHEPTSSVLYEQTFTADDADSGPSTQ